MPSLKTFLEYRSKKSDERLNFSCQKRKVKKKEQTSTVQINIGIMSLQKDIMKPVRGKTLILDPDTDATGLHRLAVKKMTDFNSDLDEGPYVLIYPDTSEVINILAMSSTIICLYADLISGWSAIKMSLTSCFPIGEQQDAQTLIRKSSPGNLSMKVLQKALQRKQALPGHQIRVKRKSTYTQLYAPIVVDEDEDGSQDFNVVPISADPAKKSVDTSISAAQIIEDLAYAIDHNTVSRFNITHSNVWDGAVRGFRRSTFCEKSDLLVRFMDDAGSVEEGIDAGGPRREFLTLLMSFLQSLPIFEGPTESVLVFHHLYPPAIKEDEYFMAGKMIAVSIVHGGPGPIFFQGTWHVSSVEEKHTVVAEYLTWYTIGRNHSVIERFKDGLASLHFLDALCQHPSVLAPVLCHTDKRLTSVEVERLFLPQLSPAGSNRRTTETVALSFWADYLMDCEEQGPVSLEELFMFITGLKTTPCRNDTPSMCHVFTGDYLSHGKHLCKHHNTSTTRNVRSFQSQYGLWHPKLPRFWMSVKW
ncbi:hypothetical protein F7725_012462 [Dissostichus mawsoni]|uniref:HECT domain-containing protein n=1 Tax=Dissostichus mawsoni TaxID=36200 RepID=A0A7J5YMT7_DISMA|nr:hypothetical protein F7725_012462 [Dissostichus mawsoni]